MLDYYKKAYDMVPHPWIQEALETVGAPEFVARVVREVMTKWMTDIEVWGTEGKCRLPVKLRLSHPCSSVSVWPRSHLS